MRVKAIKTGWIMTMKGLLRNRVAAILLFLIPSLFFTLIVLTTTERIIPFKLASVSEEMIFEVSERKEALVFVGLAAGGLIVAFLGLNLAQNHSQTDRRLVLCGYRTSELIASKLAVLLTVVLLIGCYVASILFFLVQPRHITSVLLGSALGGYVYGCYGLLVGAVVRRELEGILFVVLLANIDAGWLQNPIYYAEAQNQAIIRHLPAYFPSQISMVAAFTDHSIFNPFLGALIYGTILLAGALLIYGRRMGIRKEQKGGQTW